MPFPLPSRVPLAARLAKSPFFRNVAIVMSGTVVAQAVGMLIMPLVTRLYSPADFGVLGAFNAFLSIAGAGIALQYSDAVVLPKSDLDAAALVAASSLSILVLTGLLGAGVLLFPGFFRSWAGQGGAGWMLLFLILALPVTGLNQTLQAWCTRRKAFKTTAHSQMARPACSLSMQVAAGFAHLGWGGLVSGSIAGDAAATAVLARESLRADGSLLRQAFTWKHLKAVGREYVDFPLYSMPQNVLNAASQGIPVLLLTRYFGPAVAGSYALGMRVLQAPMSLILTSVRQVLLQRATEVHNHGQRLWPLLARSTGLLALIAFAPAVLIALLSPVVFRWAFGPDWGLAGECARWLVLWLGIMFCNLPAALLGRILRQQRNLLIFDVLLLAARVTSLVLAARALSPVQTVMVFSLVGFAFNVFFILWIAALVLRHDRHLAPPAAVSAHSTVPDFKAHVPRTPVSGRQSVLGSP